MLRALRMVSVERGLDPRGFALMAFGGAGPLHAAAMARELGVQSILCPSVGGVLCALGLAGAAARRDAARTVMLSGDALAGGRIAAERDSLVERARADLEEEPVRTRVRYEMRYVGQSFELAVEPEAADEDHPPDPVRLRELFERAHEGRYGYSEADTEVQLVTIRVSVWGRAAEPRLAAHAGAPPTRERRPVIFDGSELQADYLTGEPQHGMRIDGPAIWALGGSTLLVPPGWSGEVAEHGTIRLRDER